MVVGLNPSDEVEVVSQRLVGENAHPGDPHRTERPGFRAEPTHDLFRMRGAELPNARGPLELGLAHLVVAAH